MRTIPRRSLDSECTVNIDATGFTEGDTHEGSIRFRSYYSHDVGRRCSQVRHFLRRNAGTLSLEIMYCTMTSQYELANPDATNDYRNVYVQAATLTTASTLAIEIHDNYF